MDFIILSILWLAYCFLHSWLISLKVSRFVQSKTPHLQKWYRLLYNFIAVITVIPPVLFSRNMHSKVVFNWNDNWIFLQYFLYLLVLIYGAGGALVFNMKEFLGIEQILSKKAKQQAGIGDEIHKIGILAWVRHPWYAAAIIALWTRTYTTTALIENIILTGYLFIGTLLEERKLKMTYGEEYVNYCKEVSMYVPFKYLKAKLNC